MFLCDRGGCFVVFLVYVNFWGELGLLLISDLGVGSGFGEGCSFLVGDV